MRQCLTVIPHSDTCRQEVLGRCSQAILVEPQLASASNAEQLLWRAAYYQVIETLRRHAADNPSTKQLLADTLEEVTVHTGANRHWLHACRRLLMVSSNLNISYFTVLLVDMIAVHCNMLH